MEQEKFLAPFPTEKASSRLSSKIVWKSNPTGLAAILFQNSSVCCHQTTCSGDNPNSSSNIALGIAYLAPQMCLRRKSLRLLCCHSAIENAFAAPQPKSPPPLPSKVLRATSKETNVISIQKVCEPQVPNLYPNSWGRGVQMVMQPINEDAKQGGTEWAALPEPNGWTLAVATLTIVLIDSKEPSYKD
ncbi:TPA: hypothetical protein ACH3X1_010241 [Trebouxia sp. C0004]